MKTVVIDTNIIVSAVLTENGNAAKIMELVSGGVLQMCYCAEMMAEYTEVLAREKFGFSPKKQRALIEKLSAIGILVDVTGSDIHFVDESDRMFFDVARSCGALLITGNKRHYPEVPFVVSPAEFLALI